MKIALIGHGKMGQMIERIALSRGHEIVSIIDIENPEDFNTDAFRSAEVAIEFTTPSAAYGNICSAFEQGVKVVSGSTGWITQHGEEMRQRCWNDGKTLLWSSNFSVGVAIFRAINRRLAQIMNKFPQYDVSLQETHHVHKLDAPSGTAITLAEQIVCELDRKERWTKGIIRHGDGTKEGSTTCPINELRVDAIRSGEVPGIHTITYDSPEDCISITHSAHSRQGFALGAVLAAEFVAEHEGWLTIEDLFNF
ncbi:MAG: 4-hydroxy-tetrahydrodipicolinate reductase [Bacteroidaceae bacterium]|nr:4-hydroxy-tetrahydrodipicolinate reductase [Bacteroidaceae bacterium]